MLQYLSGVSRVNLRKKTQLTKPIYILFSEIGEDKIMRIKSAFSQPNDSPEMISSDMSQASVSSASQSKPAYDHSYFRNKILDQYPNFIKCEQCEIEIVV